MLVCEGCPVVAHADCYGLTNIPQDDWYCNKCTTKPRQLAQLDVTQAAAAEKNAEHENDTSQTLNSLENILEELKSYRLSKIAQKERGNVSVCEDDSIQPDDAQLGTLEQHETPEAEELHSPVMAVKDDADLADKTPVMRPRGRPRKSDTAFRTIVEHQAIPEDPGLHEPAPTVKDIADLAEEMPVRRPRGRPRKKDVVFRKVVEKNETSDDEEWQETKCSVKVQPTGNLANQRIKRLCRQHVKNEKAFAQDLETALTVKEGLHQADQPIKRPRGRPPKIGFPSPCSFEGSLFHGSCPGDIVRKGYMTFYIAKEDDQISALAKIFDVSVEKLVHINIKKYPSLKKHSKLKAHTRIKLPPHSGVQNLHADRSNSETSITITRPRQNPTNKDDSENSGTEFTDVQSVPISMTSQAGHLASNGCLNEECGEITANGNDSSVSEFSYYEDCIASVDEIQEDNHSSSISDISSREVLVELPVDAQANQSIVIQMPQAEDITPKVLQITCPSFIPSPGCQSRRLVRVKLPVKE